MRIVIRMDGRLRVVDTTTLDYKSNIVLASDYLSAIEPDKNGILLERCAYTSLDEGRMAVKPEPLCLIAPDELAAIESVEVDGITFAARFDGVLRCVMLDSLYDEDGNLDPPPVSGMRIYYRSGSYEAITPTPLLYHDGHLAQDDMLDYADPSRGISWDRGVWTTDDAGLMSLRPEASVVIGGDELDSIAVATFEGDVVYCGEYVCAESAPLDSETAG
mgnify:CR=1 FL=1